MATTRICSIPDCDKTHYAKGWCYKHWERWRRTGDPLALTRPEPGELVSFLEQNVLVHRTDGCLKWPYSGNGNGYGKITYGGRRQYVHRLVCEIVNGPPPSPFHEAAHTCGQGRSGCVSPLHLAWKTRKENEADKIAHGSHQYGERNKMAKLSEPDIQEIRRLKGTLTQAQIGARFGVHQVHVSRILRSTRWGQLE